MLFAIALLVGSVADFAAYLQAFHEDSFSKVVWNEMGTTWVVTSIAAPLAPLTGVLIVLLKSSPQTARGFSVIDHCRAPDPPRRDEVAHDAAE
jgi:hypothetical protein